MAAKNPAYKVGLASPSYVDLTPKTELKEEENVDTLIISVPGFKKEQLRVQASNVGILKVTGEKPENTDKSKIIRFIKEATLPKNCDVNQIRAKFANGELRIIMPKKVMPPPPVVAEEQNKQQHEEAASMTPSKSEDTPVTKPGTVGNTDPKRGHGKEQVVGLGSNLLTKLQGKKMNNVVIGLGVSMVAMIGIGAFMAYKYGSLSSSSSSYMEE